MNKNIGIIVGVIALVVIVGGAYALLNSSNDAMVAKEKAEKQATMEGTEGSISEVRELTVILNAQNNSQEKGVAILSEMNGKTRVVVNVNGAPAGSSQPMHIHVGSCPTPGAVKYPLNNLVNGKSETILDIAFAQLMSEVPLAINAHRSSTELKAYMSCGDLPIKEAMMKGATAKTDSMMNKEETSMVDKGDTMMKAGSYEAYASEKVTLASATHDVVLFFRASWCPTCRAVDADIRANLPKIPSSLTILDVNYDTATALKQKYSVTYQHTFVQVDKDGNVIKKWSGSPTLTLLISEVQ